MAQCELRDSEEATNRVSQEVAYRHLVDRNAALEKTHTRVVKERDDARQTLSRFRKFKEENEELILRVRSLESATKAHINREAKLREENSALELRITKAVEERRQESSIRQMRDEEVARLRAEVLKLRKAVDERLPEEWVDLHIAFQNNCATGDVSSTRSLDETPRCFEDEEEGITCQHALAHVQGRLLQLGFRKKTKKIKIVKK